MPSISFILTIISISVLFISFILSIVTYIILSQKLASTDFTNNSDKQKSYQAARIITLCSMILLLLLLLVYIYLLWTSYGSITYTTIKQFSGIETKSSDEICMDKTCGGIDDIKIKA